VSSSCGRWSPLELVAATTLSWVWGERRAHRVGMLMIDEAMMFDNDDDDDDLSSKGRS